MSKFVTVVFLLFFLVYPAGATDYTSTSFIIRDPVISVGGARATSSSYELFTSTGQTVIGETSSSNFTYRSGFLYFTDPVADTPASTPTPTPTIIGGGGPIPGFRFVPLVVPRTDCTGAGDLNSDCGVNLIDISIAAFWWQKDLSEVFARREVERLSGDGLVDLIDFSIIAFNWTDFI